jgi:hypothetical protein
MRGFQTGRGINPIWAPSRNVDAAGSRRQHLAWVNFCFTFGEPQITL